MKSKIDYIRLGRLKSGPGDYLYFDLDVGDFCIRVPEDAVIFDSPQDITNYIEHRSQVELGKPQYRVVDYYCKPWVYLGYAKNSELPTEIASGAFSVLYVDLTDGHICLYFAIEFDLRKLNHLPKLGWDLVLGLYSAVSVGKEISLSNELAEDSLLSVLIPHSAELLGDYRIPSSDFEFLYCGDKDVVVNIPIPERLIEYAESYSVYYGIRLASLDAVTVRAKFNRLLGFPVSLTLSGYADQITLHAKEGDLGFSLLGNFCEVTSYCRGLNIWVSENTSPQMYLGGQTPRNVVFVSQGGEDVVLDLDLDWKSPASGFPYKTCDFSGITLYPESGSGTTIIRLSGGDSTSIYWQEKSTGEKFSRLLFETSGFSGSCFIPLRLQFGLMCVTDSERILGLDTYSWFNPRYVVVKDSGDISTIWEEVKKKCNLLGSAVLHGTGLSKEIKEHTAWTDLPFDDWFEAYVGGCEGKLDYIESLFTSGGLADYCLRIGRTSEFIRIILALNNYHGSLISALYEDIIRGG